jgi:hypothetical protein
MKTFSKIIITLIFLASAPLSHTMIVKKQVKQCGFNKKSWDKLSGKRAICNSPFNHPKEDLLTSPWLSKKTDRHTLVQSAAYLKDNALLIYSGTQDTAKKEKIQLLLGHNARIAQSAIKKLEPKRDFNMGIGIVNSAAALLCSLPMYEKPVFAMLVLIQVASAVHSGIVCNDANEKMKAYEDIIEVEDSISTYEHALAKNDTNELK